MPGCYFFHKKNISKRKITNTMIKLKFSIVQTVSNSSTGQFWPILGQVEQQEPFVIGIYYAAKMPATFKSFLRHFIDDDELKYVKSILILYILILIEELPMTSLIVFLSIICIWFCWVLKKIKIWMTGSASFLAKMSTVQINSSLDSFSAFSFENKLGKIKNLLRGGIKPLKSKLPRDYYYNNLKYISRIKKK